MLDDAAVQLDADALLGTAPSDSGNLVITLAQIGLREVTCYLGGKQDPILQAVNGVGCVDILIEGRVVGDVSVRAVLRDNAIQNGGGVQGVRSLVHGVVRGGDDVRRTALDDDILLSTTIQPNGKKDEPAVLEGSCRRSDRS